MFKLSISILIALITFKKGESQKYTLPAVKTGWERIYVKNVGSFDLPSTMEIQSGQYKQMMNDAYKRMEYEAPQIVAQQRGLNGMSNEGFGRYARVMLETQIGGLGDFEKLNFDFSKYSTSDVRELSLEFKRQIENSFFGTGLELIEWYPLRFERINGMSCIHTSFKRRLRDNLPVLVHVYYFHNNDRMHTLTMSYRISEGNYWKEDYMNILNSFRIYNIR